MYETVPLQNFQLDKPVSLQTFPLDDRENAMNDADFPGSNLSSANLAFEDQAGSVDTSKGSRSITSNQSSCLLAVTQPNHRTCTFL